MNGIKYIILDFGKVLFKPTTGEWFITPMFLKLVDISKIDIEDYKRVKNSLNYLLSKQVTTEDDEYDLFCEFYDKLLKGLNYPEYDESIAKKIAYDFVYNDTKYTMYDGVIDELETLSSKYKLILLTDNWPCVLRILEEYNLSNYFDKIYVSSIYGCEKHEGVFFDYPINDYNIQSGEAIFIDDSEKLLSIAESKGLEVKLMDRENVNPKTDYEVIHDLKELIKGSVIK